MKPINRENKEIVLGKKGTKWRRLKKATFEKIPKWHNDFFVLPNEKPNPANMCE